VSRSLLGLAVLDVLWLCGPCAAATPIDARAKTNEPSAAEYCRLVTEQNGLSRLDIHYPWAFHENLSVEVQLIARSGAGGLVRSPTFFWERYFHGRARIQVYRAEDASAGGATETPLTIGKNEFTIRMRRNTSGNPVGCVLRNHYKSRPGAKIEEEERDKRVRTGVTAIFYCPAQWSLDRTWLTLDLPPGHFSDPGQLHVWLLRDSQVLWEETLDWRGYGE